MEIVFWVSVLLVGYVYLGYPALLAAWSAAAGRDSTRRRNSDPSAWPSVSVIIAARNEASRLAARVENLLEQSYPHPLDIIVVSDGSTDRTHNVIDRFGGRIRLIELPHGGKPLALNAGVAAARGEIVVFADARQSFARDAVQQLASRFADPEIGGVTGELILDCENNPEAAQSTIGEGVGLYWRYEKWLRRHESRVGSTLGATGAIYAIRRSLWRPLPVETLLDDVLAPMRVVLGGKRVVFEERARAFDRAAADGPTESRRKIRTLAGNYQILRLEPRVLLPGVNPIWVQYLSHKFGRLLVPWALLTMFVSSTVLAGASWFYFVALILQLCFYGLAALGALMEARERGADRADELAAMSPHNGARLPGHRIPRVSGGTRV